MDPIGDLEACSRDPDNLPALVADDQNRDAKREEGEFRFAAAPDQRNGFVVREGASEEISSESSSIGVPDDSEDDIDGGGSGGGDEDEVQSALSMGSLEDSLPIKRRGLSNYYAGRSKSFGNLAEVKSIKDIEKAENPFNKRRRTLIACKLSWSDKKKKNKSHFYGHSNPISMPLFPLSEGSDDDETSRSTESLGQRGRVFPGSSRLNE
ncbi:hypothetical protein Nepgr_015241 [Nepenthes gracilis]|uniref:Uncharacterized protein n=1 Tax=Nepenthes gracilis TaxID=150966 RepID=A0AAD3SKP0_NEPGR|nr:hypothetical protein Nepgr_015241 [Nepenthes gracilis]